MTRTRKAYTREVWVLWLIALPGVLHFVIFRYVPLLGNFIAFQDYSIFKGVLGSSWVGFKHFIRMFTFAEFRMILGNTLLLSFYSIVFGFPAPLILSLFLNEIRWTRTKKVVQTVLYLPHFLSWVIVGGLFINFLGLDGFLNQILGRFGTKPVDFITQPPLFLPILTAIGIWKEVGWGMIIYLAAMSTIDPTLYEAAVVDGAGRWRQMWLITLPSLIPAIVVLSLLRIANLLNANVEQVLIFLNPLVRSVGEVIDTYVYRSGLQNSQFSYSTAIGIFKSLIGFSLVVGLNQLSRRATGESIY